MAKKEESESSQIIDITAMLVATRLGKFLPVVGSASSVDEVIKAAQEIAKRIVKICDGEK